MAERIAKLPLIAKLLIGAVAVLCGLPLLGTFLAVLVAVMIGPSGGPNELSVWEGRPAPDLEVTTTDGSTLQLADLRGRAVVIDCWATWCGPCVREIPHLQRVADEFPEKLSVVGISTEDLPLLQQFSKSKSLRYPIGVATKPAEPFANVTALPTTFFIDSKGMIRKVLVGYHDYSDLRAQVAAIVP